MTDEIWIMKDGREILVSEMSTEHIRNARRMVSKLQNDTEHWIDIFTQELKRRENIE